MHFISLIKLPLGIISYDMLGVIVKSVGRREKHIVLDDSADINAADSALFKIGFQFIGLPDLVISSQTRGYKAGHCAVVTLGVDAFSLRNKYIQRLEYRFGINNYLRVGVYSLNIFKRKSAAPGLGFQL